MFAVRIVTVDHYMATPTRDLDVGYSYFRGGAVKQVPVVRIFGATPAGQKTCMHLHGVFPYISVPFDSSESWEKYAYQLAISIDRALNISMGHHHASAQHVFKVTLISAVPFYGYHENERKFLKIYFYNPLVIKKAVELLENGAVMNHIFQPHEAHVPFILQMFIDFNLCGMNFIYANKVKFRRVDDCALMQHRFPLRSSSQSVKSSVASGNLLRNFWDPYNIPSELLSPEDFHRQSICELEVDAVITDIMISDESGVETSANSGLRAIWEDERQRRRNAGESSQLSCASTQERDNMISESERLYKQKLFDILKEKFSYDVNECNLLTRDNLIANEDVIQHSTPSSLKHERADEISGWDVEKFDSEPMVNEELTLSLTSNPSSQQKNFVDILDTQDEELIEFLANINDNRDLAPVEEADSLLHSQNKLLVNEMDGCPVVELDDDQETWEMSQQIWDTNCFNDVSLSRNCDKDGKNSFSHEEDQIPQVDGPVDPKFQHSKSPESRPLHQRRRFTARKSTNGYMSHGLTSLFPEHGNVPQVGSDSSLFNSVTAPSSGMSVVDQHVNSEHWPQRQYNLWNANSDCSQQFSNSYCHGAAVASKRDNCNVESMHFDWDSKLHVPERNPYINFSDGSHQNIEAFGNSVPNDENTFSTSSLCGSSQASCCWKTSSNFIAYESMPNPEFQSCSYNRMDSKYISLQKLSDITKEPEGFWVDKNLKDGRLESCVDGNSACRSNDNCTDVLNIPELNVVSSCTNISLRDTDEVVEKLQPVEKFGTDQMSLCDGSTIESLREALDSLTNDESSEKTCDYPENRAKANATISSAPRVVNSDEVYNDMTEDLSSLMAPLQACDYDLQTVVKSPVNRASSEDSQSDSLKTNGCETGFVDMVNPVDIDVSWNNREGNFSSNPVHMMGDNLPFIENLEQIDKVHCDDNVNQEEHELRTPVLEKMALLINNSTVPKADSSMRNSNTRESLKFLFKLSEPSENFGKGNNRTKIIRNLRLSRLSLGRNGKKKKSLLDDSKTGVMEVGPIKDSKTNSPRRGRPPKLLALKLKNSLKSIEKTANLSRCATNVQFDSPKTKNRQQKCCSTTANLDNHSSASLTITPRRRGRPRKYFPLEIKSPLTVSPVEQETMVHNEDIGDVLKKQDNIVKCSLKKQDFEGKKIGYNNLSSPLQDSIPSRQLDEIPMEKKISVQLNDCIKQDVADCHRSTSDQKKHCVLFKSNGLQNRGTKGMSETHSDSLRPPTRSVHSVGTNVHPRDFPHVHSRDYYVIKYGKLKVNVPRKVKITDLLKFGKEKLCLPKLSPKLYGLSLIGHVKNPSYLTQKDVKNDHFSDDHTLEQKNKFEHRFFSKPKQVIRFKRRPNQWSLHSQSPSGLKIWLKSPRNPEFSIVNNRIDNTSNSQFADDVQTLCDEESVINGVSETCHPRKKNKCLKPLNFVDKNIVNDCLDHKLQKRMVCFPRDKVLGQNKHSDIDRIIDTANISKQPVNDLKNLKTNKNSNEKLSVNYSPVLKISLKKNRLSLKSNNQSKNIIIKTTELRNITEPNKLSDEDSTMRRNDNVSPMKTRLRNRAHLMLPIKPNKKSSRKPSLTSIQKSVKKETECQNPNIKLNCSLSPTKCKFPELRVIITPLSKKFLESQNDTSSSTRIKRGGRNSSCNDALWNLAFPSPGVDSRKGSSPPAYWSPSREANLNTLDISAKNPSSLKLKLKRISGNDNFLRIYNTPQNQVGSTKQDCKASLKKKRDLDDDDSVDSDSDHSPLIHRNADVSELCSGESNPAGTSHPKKEDKSITSFKLDFSNIRKEISLAATLRKNLKPQFEIDSDFAFLSDTDDEMSNKQPANDGFKERYETMNDGINELHEIDTHELDESTLILSDLSEDDSPSCETPQKSNSLPSIFISQETTAKENETFPVAGLVSADETSKFLQEDDKNKLLEPTRIDCDQNIQNLDKKMESITRCENLLRINHGSNLKTDTLNLSDVGSSNRKQENDADLNSLRKSSLVKEHDLLSSSGLFECSQELFSSISAAEENLWEDISSDESERHMPSNVATNNDCSETVKTDDVTFRSTPTEYSSSLINFLRQESKSSETSELNEHGGENLAFQMDTLDDKEPRVTDFEITVQLNINHEESRGPLAETKGTLSKKELDCLSIKENDNEGNRTALKKLDTGINEDFNCEKNGQVLSDTNCRVKQLFDKPEEDEEAVEKSDLEMKTKKSSSLTSSNAIAKSSKKRTSLKMLERNKCEKLSTNEEKSITQESKILEQTEENSRLCKDFEVDLISAVSECTDLPRKDRKVIGGITNEETEQAVCSLLNIINAEQAIPNEIDTQETDFDSPQDDYGQQREDASTLKNTVSENKDSCLKTEFKMAETNKNISKRPTILKYDCEPPSRIEISQTAHFLGIPEVAHQDAFCSDLADIPERSGDSVGHCLRRSSHHLQHLHDFEGKFQASGLENWRMILAMQFGSGIESTNTDYLKQLKNNSHVRAALAPSKRVMVLTPNIAPPSRQSVNEWIKIHSLNRRDKKVSKNKKQKKNGEINLVNEEKASFLQKNVMDRQLDSAGLRASSCSLNRNALLVREGMVSELDKSLEKHHLSIIQEENSTQQKDGRESSFRSTSANTSPQLDWQERDSRCSTPAAQPKHSTPIVHTKKFPSPLLTPVGVKMTKNGSLRKSMASKRRCLDLLTRDNTDGNFNLRKKPKYLYKNPVSTLDLEQSGNILPVEKIADGAEGQMSLNKSEASTSQQTIASRISSPTESVQNTSYFSSCGFKLSLQNLQEAKNKQECQYLTTLAMELHINTREDFRPDPEYDSVLAVFYHILNEVPAEDSSEQNITGAIIVDKAAAETSAHCLCSRSKIGRSPLAAKDKYGSVSQSSDVNQTKIPTNSACRCHHFKRKLLAKTGIADFNLVFVPNELQLFEQFSVFVQRTDPDILVGYELQKLSWGFMLQRATFLGINLHSILSRIPDSSRNKADLSNKEEIDFGYLNSEMQLVGRIVLNLWRLMRHEAALTSYSFENVIYHILHKRIPLFSFRTLTEWFMDASNNERWRVVEYYVTRVKGNVELLAQVDLIGRTSELARLFGIQFFEVLSRGSQFRVESLMLRLARHFNYIAVSPSIEQRARMRAPECLALIMEPESKFYPNPVLVLDFQSLYPSMIIAYNYCFSTCLGRLELFSRDEPFEFGCTHLTSPPELLKNVAKEQITISPVGVAFVKSSVRQGVLPKMLSEILETRIMVKKAMKKCQDNKALYRILDARQLGLKLIANVTYGYTAANFSGRMPCVEVADSIVSKARETLERAIRMVINRKEWDAKVVYGDTDSLFVHLPGRNKEAAFRIGQEIADAVTAANPKPVKLKFEKVYMPCILQTKKRYVGYMYETVNQKEPVLDAKGIETIRRDGCPAAVKILEKSLRILFNSHDITQVKRYVQRQYQKFLEGNISLQDCIFAREYRGRIGYKPGARVPALEITKRLLKKDRRSEPCSGERVPYVIVYGSPGEPLFHLVRQPEELLLDPNLRVNAHYYINNIIAPSLQRVFGLVGIDIKNWYSTLPRTIVNQTNVISDVPYLRKGTISQYFNSSNCPVCSEPFPKGGTRCSNCQKDPQTAVITLMERTKNLEMVYLQLKQICWSCTGVQDQELRCTSLECPNLYRLVQAAHGMQQVPYLRNLQNIHSEF